MFKIIAILTLLMGPLMLQSQQTRDFAYYDTQTLTLYEEDRWKQLISLGKEALNQGHNYYYLRMRIGIAYYNSAKYKLAVAQFVDALSKNADDPLALEYLYYSYLFAGREADALSLYSRHRNALSHISASNSKLIKGVYGEAAIKFSDDQVEEVGGIQYFHVGVKHQISPSWSLYQGYSRLTQEFSRFTEVDGGGPGPGSGGGNNTVEEQIRNHQNEYYVRANFRILRGWQLIPTFHYQGVADSLNNQVFSVGILKQAGIADFYGAVAFSNINNEDQTQWTLGATIYPLANLNFYLQTHYTLHDQLDQQRNILIHKVGGKIASRTWLEAFAAWGDMYNFHEMDAFYIHNIPHVIETKVGINVIRVINHRHKLQIGYLMEDKSVVDTGESFKHHTIFAGLNLRL